MRRIAAAALLTMVLAGCGTSPEVPRALTAAERDEAFWTAYEKRLGMVGRDYADAEEARAGAIKFAHTVCDEFDKGIDRDVAISQVTGRYATAAEAKVQIDTAIEFYCPQHA